MPVGEDGSFAKKSMVAKKNRYKDKFPCTVQMLVASCKLLVDMNCCSLTKARPSLVNYYYLHLVATVYYYYILVEVKVLRNIDYVQKFNFIKFQKYFTKRKNTNLHTHCRHEIQLRHCIQNSFIIIMHHC